MKHSALIMFATALVLGACSNNGSTPGLTLPGQKPDTPGKALFETNCTPCHGTTGISGVNGAADLQHISLADEYIQNAITNGLPNMPAFGKTLNPTEIQQLTAYVQSLSHGAK